MKKFKKDDVVEILGTDNITGWISICTPSNTDMYLVGLYTYDIEAVYPYHGNFRLYPEHMLTLHDNSIN